MVWESTVLKTVQTEQSGNSKKNTFTVGQMSLLLSSRNMMCNFQMLKGLY